MLRHSSLLALTLTAFLGCGPSTGTISGTVTVDGKPVENGVISFIPADNSRSAPVTVDIQSGRYTAQAETGQKLVQISAPHITGQRKAHNGPDAPLLDITEESIPAKYNSETELKFDVKRGTNTKDWTIEGVKRK